MKEYEQQPITLGDVTRIADEHLLLNRCTGKRIYVTHYHGEEERLELDCKEFELTGEQMETAEWYLEYEKISKDGTPLLRLNARKDGDALFAGAVYLSPAPGIVDRVLELLQ